MKHKPLDQQVIVVTGASSGIGLCTALLAAERGASVALLARSRETLSEACALIEESGGNALSIVADVSSREQVEAAVEAVIRHFGRIDTWVNNAGVAIYGRLEEVSEEDSRRLFDINYWGVVNGSLAVLPTLRAHGGALINVGSEVSDAVIPLQGMYSASKHAVKGFTDALRVEVETIDKAPLSIVLIQPTAVNTPYPQHARNYLQNEPKLPTPMIDPEKVAGAILDAAESGGRDVPVGAVAHMNTTMSKLLPRLGDRMSAMQEKRQITDQPARDRMGTLYKPGESGRVHGFATGG